jgi:hypothetical protein
MRSWSTANDNAHEHFRASLTLARNPMEQLFLKERLRACEPRDVTPVVTEPR